VDELPTPLRRPGFLTPRRRTIDMGGQDGTGPGNQLNFDARKLSYQLIGTTITVKGFAPVTFLNVDFLNLFDLSGYPYSRGRRFGP